MNRVSSLAVSVPRTCVRRLSATEVRCRDNLPKIKEMQRHFQKEDGVPVYIKGGPTDKFLFYLTVTLVTYGLGCGIYSTYKVANKK